MSDRRFFVIWSICFFSLVFLAALTMFALYSLASCGP
jgi:hypothetical protein